jgi:uncharacterized protein (DUF849 family)
MEHDAVILEVGLNEAAMRSHNPNVPYSPAECAADALRCRDAGAAVVHWHARDPISGVQRLGDAALYGEALDAMETSDVIAYPSYPLDPAGSLDRLEHCWRLRERHGLTLAPVDLGSVTIVMWDGVARRFAAIDVLRQQGVVQNSLPFTLDALERIYRLGMVPTVAAFDVGATREMVLLVESGALRPPVFYKIFLAGTWAVGPFPTEEALDFHLRQIPQDLDVEWVLVPYAISDPTLVDRLCRHALGRGGGIRVGIGDNPEAYPTATNADLVERAAAWAAEAGRPLASAADVRRRLGLPAARPVQSG